ncbi:hypothetical protein [Paenibacillus silvae]|uniref:hypothetical protein n=1 Tax=Paenibacillus silvae TaxID=1325358 RepID=UPI0011AA883B|nr:MULTISPECIES: hypothetical protein [Paenibacillus]MCK6077967.1 BtrH N-terminal domain-containing protein [Paenibacillus silvae]MCK6152166.1 BtrH N-terminal domain-containing protein [Paenibacillus silvae]MCK6270850.1 BtrH N-terminal domain-containing protein [Paenibacillus silvae]
MIIHSFAPTLDIPYYYPCNFPLIHEVLERQGSMSSLPLLAASRLYTLPSCGDSGLVKAYFHKLDYEEPIWKLNNQQELRSFEEGIIQIRRQLETGRLFLATGTSYHLPYCDDYHNPEYIHKHVKQGSRLHLVDHWLAVYGMDEHYIHVYDPVPSKFKGKVKYSAFHDFWRGNQAISELAGVKRKEALQTYGTMDVRATVPLDSQGYREMLAQALTTHVHEFLTGRRITEGERNFYFGHAVSASLVNSLKGSTGGDAESETRLAGLLFDMRWSRYFFRDLLKETAQWLGAPLDQYAREYANIILRWEKANNLLQVGRMKHSEGWRAQLSGVVQELVADEWRWYESLRRALPQASTYARQSRTVIGPDYRSDLLRIVLDSCRELNAYHNTFIPLEEGGNAPLYGRDGQLDSLQLVSLLAVVEQGIEEQWGKEIGNALAEIAAATLPESPYQTVGSLVDYLAQQWMGFSDREGSRW